MDRICPFLALDDDRRSAVDGFDPAHRCLAVVPPSLVDRSTQAGLCLHEGHAECPRFKEADTQRVARRAIPRPAPDATFASTRVILGPDASWGGVGLVNAGFRQRGRVVLTGASVLLLLGAAAAGASTNGFGLLAATGSGTPQPTVAPLVTATPVPTIGPSSSPTAAVSPTPTLSPASSSPTPAVTAKPTPQTYVVQLNDTLSSIAARFGVTVQQLVAANHIANPSQLSIGQVLIIP